ncbi:MAG TPA: DUF5777 family beta-barrel protein [Bacteroidia bacterium]|nr:DUF5777 family beta-barrel protein [Bacteroidia bacterium]HNU32110.1 DUF5777 family beta-barrel protein [Bacteroidia bacterium]
MKVKFFVPLVAAVAISINAHAQEDLLKLAMDENKPKNEKVEYTFKTTKLINAQTNETVHKRTLDFRVGHRFGNIGKYTEGKSAAHSLYGLDASADIRIAFEYGITDNLTVGISRSKVKENLEGLVKYRILQQTTDNKIPVGLTFFGNTAFTPIKDGLKIYDKTSRRLSYVAQLMVARKFSERISFVLLPSYLHRNYVFDIEDENDFFSLGVGARVKITKRTSLVADYFYNFSQYRIDRNESYFNPLGAGIEVETGGHVFTIMFSNSAPLIENEFLPNTTDSWSDGGFKFSFNISRNFML